MVDIVGFGMAVMVCMGFPHVRGVVGFNLTLCGQ